MPASLRRSASAWAAMATNSAPRWLISITDMPASCQLTSSRFAFALEVAVAVFAIFVVTIEDALQSGELLAFAQVDERHALGRAAHLADLVHAGTDQHAAGGDQHDLILGADQRRRDDLAVAL